MFSNEKCANNDFFSNFSKLMLNYFYECYDMNHPFSKCNLVDSKKNSAGPCFDNVTSLLTVTHIFLMVKKLKKFFKNHFLTK